MSTCVEEAVQAALIADPGIAVLVPASSIKVAFAGQLLPTPYIVHFPVSGSPTQLLGEMAALKVWSSYQVSVFSDKYSSGEAVMAAVVAALGRLTTAEGVQFILSGLPRFIGFDPGIVGAESVMSTGTFHLMAEFQIFEAL